MVSEKTFEKIADELFDLNIWSEIESDDIPSYTFWFGKWFYLWFGYMGDGLIKEWYSLSEEDFVSFDYIYELSPQNIQEKMLYGLVLLKEGKVDVIGD